MVDRQTEIMEYIQILEFEKILEFSLILVFGWFKNEKASERD